MTDAELERLAVWAQRHNPDREGQVHLYHGGCPWCIGNSDPEPAEGYDGGGSHSLGLALIEEVQRLRSLIAAMTAEPHRATTTFGPVASFLVRPRRMRGG